MVLKKKLFKHFILLLILALFFVGCYNESKINYTEIEYSEFLEKVNNQDDFYVIFEKDDCPSCPKFIEKFNELAKNKNILFFIINTNKIEEDQKESCKDKYDLEVVPNVLFIENGNMKSKLIGTDNELEIKKFQKSHLD